MLPEDFELNPEPRNHLYPGWYEPLLVHQPLDKAEERMLLEMCQSCHKCQKEKTRIKTGGAHVMLRNQQSNLCLMINGPRQQVGMRQCNKQVCDMAM